MRDDFDEKLASFFQGCKDIRSRGDGAKTDDGLWKLDRLQKRARRGNIFDPDNGLSRMGRFGPAYIR